MNEGKTIMNQNSENQIERLLKKPFWVVDFLPERKCKILTEKKSA